MKLIKHEPKFNKQLYDLINCFNRLVPPNLDMEDREIATILEFPSHYLDLRFPNDGGEVVTYLMLRNDEISCAAQVVLPEDDAYFNWFVANPKYFQTDDIATFITEIKIICSDNGCQSLGFNRNIFGNGWIGIPDCWDEVLKKFLSQGFIIDDKWEIYWLSQGVKLSDLPLVSVTFNYENERTIEASLFSKADKIGEADIWLPSCLSESLNNFGIATLEYIEIYRDFRRNGYGKSAISSIIKELNSIGFTKMMLWTETQNMPMKHLASSMNFSKGPTLYWLKVNL